MAEWVYQGVAPIDRGLGVRHQDIGTRGSRALLRNQAGDEIALWVYEIETSFSMDGALVQSVHHREFYPHNFVQPTLTVRGQTPNSFEYNRLSEFIRESHQKAVFYDESGYVSPAIRFELRGGGHTTERNTKGYHQRLVLRGFVPKFGRGARRFEFSQNYEFDFVVTRSLTGLMTDERVAGLQLKAWAEVVADPSADGFVRDPDAGDFLDRPPLAPGPNGQMRPT